jgi:hypothetical protein
MNEEEWCWMALVGLSWMIISGCKKQRGAFHILTVMQPSPMSCQIVIRAEKENQGMINF